jgi:cytochrome b561
MTQARYDTLSIALHWIMAALIVALFASGLVAEGFPREARRMIHAVHGFAGMALVVLVALRVAWRLAKPVPHGPMPGWMSLASRLAHLGLYALMLAVPLSGWWMISVQGRTLTLFGVTIPHIVARAPELRGFAEGVHEATAYALIAVAVLHAMAAIYHHVVLRDGVLRRMLPMRG